MMYLSDLPTGALAHVSSFLPSPSRALFAVAINSRDSSSAVVGNQWDVLDFGEIEKDLAAKISDDDIRGVLLSIDAVTNLKRLRLSNCINISGAGLEPLRGSTIIQQIDLSLVGDHENERLDPEPLISCTDVLPILDSIIERGEECSLKHLTSPYAWQGIVRVVIPDFHAFLTRYNELLCSRAARCLKCNCNLLPNINTDDPWYLSNMYEPWDRDHGWHFITNFGLQKNTCYECTTQYCDDCEDDRGVPYLSGVCEECGRKYCLHCEKVDTCNGGCCHCVKCADFIECSHCQENTCPDCVSVASCCKWCVMSP
mmetsp:Transcript_21231/g.31712  ORF Transcript_21231/g.31712 Transcript_21231/m.31712 type:complete len:313 (+) Transcript_21231:72-1010(+)